jgi:UrcA family protein
METIMSRFVKSAFLALAAMTAVTVPAAADPVMVTYSVKVTHGDLNLETEAGAATAMNRIEQAAGRACGKALSARQIKATKLHQECVAGATHQIVAAIDAPVLTALYAREAPVAVASR